MVHMHAKQSHINGSIQGFFFGLVSPLLALLHWLDFGGTIVGLSDFDTSSEPWWHYLFYFLLDTTMVNMWITKEVLKEKRTKSN